MTPEALVAAAITARDHAYCVYSNFAVGAAVLSSDGRVFTGCNVENASYGLTVCAERIALFKALSEGVHSFVAMAVVTEPGAALCGACRQVTREFAKDLAIHLGKPDGTFRTTTLAKLLPESFGPEDLR